MSILLAVVILAILNRVTPAHVEPVFNVLISKNRTSIANIHQPRDIEMSKQVKIDRINLADKSRFRHPKLGEIGYAEDFFADIGAGFTVKIAGDYTFYVASDDGFILAVDGVQRCEWVRDRPITTDVCNVKLSEGKHSFLLNYFQGYGNAGLTMHYGKTGSDKQYIVGDDSKYIEFDR